MQGHGVTITVTLRQCEDNANARCVVGLDVTSQGHEVSLEHGQIYVNDVGVTLPYSDDVVYIKQATSLFLLIRAFEVTVTFDRAQRLSINLGPFFESKVKIKILTLLCNPWWLSGRTVAP